MNINTNVYKQYVKSGGSKRCHNRYSYSAAETAVAAKKDSFSLSSEASMFKECGKVIRASVSEITAPAVSDSSTPAASTEETAAKPSGPSGASADISGSATGPASGPASVSKTPTGPSYGPGKPSASKPYGPGAPSYETGEADEYLGSFHATAYCGCEKCSGGHTHTYSGTIPQANHTIAADLNLFPIGTKLLINGIVYTVEDKGSSVVDNRVDIFFETHEEALAFGLQNVDVYSVK